MSPTEVTPDEAIANAIISLLSNGVPSGPISRAFNIDQTTVKAIQADLTIQQYGSAEIAELLQGAMFEAYRQAMHQMKFGSPASRQRMISLVLSKAMTLVGRQPPESFNRIRNEMSVLLTEMTTTSTTPSPYPDPDFSPASLAENETDDTDDEEE